MIYTLDDDESFNMLLNMLITPFGIGLKTHKISSDFTKSVKERAPRLCILDLNLGQMGEGFQLLKAMRKVIGADLPIIIMSRRGESKDVQRAMQLGANDFVPKPLDDQYLLLKLMEYFPENEKLQNIKTTHHTQNYPVLIGDSNGILSFEMNLKAVDGVSFEVEGDHFLLKDSSLRLTGGFVKDIFNEDTKIFRVLTSSQNIDTKKYQSTLSKDFNIDEICQLRRWLVKKNREG